MEPVLVDGEWVFCSIPPEVRAGLFTSPIFEFREAEGVTLVLPKQEAERLSIAGQFLSRMITLNVFSSLESVGFLAEVTARLAAHGVSVQPVSAFHHDHLFVPAARAEECLGILKALAQEHKDSSKFGR